jgi:hypothetical protein
MPKTEDELRERQIRSRVGCDHLVRWLGALLPPLRAAQTSISDGLLSRKSAFMMGVREAALARARAPQKIQAVAFLPRM